MGDLAKTNGYINELIQISTMVTYKDNYPLSSTNVLTTYENNASAPKRMDIIMNSSKSALWVVTYKYNDPLSYTNVLKTYASVLHTAHKQPQQPLPLSNTYQKRRAALMSLHHWIGTQYTTTRHKSPNSVACDPQFANILANFAGKSEKLSKSVTLKHN